MMKGIEKNSYNVSALVSSITPVSIVVDKKAQSSTRKRIAMNTPAVIDSVAPT
jgi:hypothetical protein|tara:strand:+ start:2663 stop:2821 length:159 start_codon:yes stop_codon:yes gene_type:complete